MNDLWMIDKNDFHYGYRENLQEDKQAHFVKRPFFWHTFIVVIILSVMTGIVSWPFLPKTYESVATLVFRAPDSKNTAAYLRQDLDEKAIQSELDIMASLPITSEVIDRLNLGNDPDFSKTPPGAIEQLTAMMGTQQFDDPSRSALKHLVLQHDRRSYTVKIGYALPDPALAMRMADMVATVYLDNLRDRKQKVIDRDIDIARSRLLSASFRHMQISKAIDEIEKLNIGTDRQARLNDLLDEKVKLVSKIDLARAQIEDGVVQQKNTEPDAEVISRPELITRPSFPNPILAGVSLLIFSSLLGAVTARWSLKALIKKL